MQKQITLVTLLLLGVLSLWAQNEPKAVTSTFALQKVTIVQAPGKVITDGTVVVKDGLIHAVGKDITIPFDAKIVKADSMIVYPGFISGAAHIGIPKVEQKDEGGRRRRDPDVKDPGNPPNDKAGIQPERQVRDLLKADENSIESMRKLGFTTAQVMPDGKMLPGQSSIILLAGESANDMILMESTALFFQFKGASGVAPATVIGVMSKIRDLYKQAEQAKAHQTAFMKAPAGMKRPESDPVLEAFYPVIDRKKPMMMKTNTSRDISRAMVLQKEMGYPLVFTGVKQGYNYVDQMKGQNVLLSLDLPKAKADKKKKEGEGEEMKEKTPEEEEMAALEMRRAEEMKKMESQAATLAGKGVNFGFSTLDAKAKDIKANIKRMMEAGLTEEQVLAALTTYPAKMLGIEKVTGTVAKGKIANLVVTDAPYFEDDANVRYVFVDGQLFEYEAKAKKKKKKAGQDGEATEEQADVAGTWTYEMSVPGQELEGMLRVEMEEDELKVFMSDPSGSGEEEEVDDANLEGDVMTFTMTVDQGGGSMTVNFELTFDGEAYEGAMSIGEFGSFDVEGVRTKKPE
ncbi:MAG: amidohydrolase family protein [Bacteroidota bacterium]